MLPGTLSHALEHPRWRRKRRLLLRPVGALGDGIPGKADQLPANLLFRLGGGGGQAGKQLVLGCIECLGESQQVGNVLFVLLIVVLHLLVEVGRFATNHLFYCSYVGCGAILGVGLCAESYHQRTHH